MPLGKGKSHEAVSKNVKTELKHGKSQKQAIAISLNQARRSGAKITKKNGKQRPDLPHLLAFGPQSAVFSRRDVTSRVLRARRHASLGRMDINLLNGTAVRGPSCASAHGQIT
jgi:hypothetical protein